MATELDKRAGAPDEPPPPVGRRRWWVPALAVVAFLIVAGPLGGIGGRLSEIQRNDNAAYLPENAEATKVLAETNAFNGIESTPVILVYTRADGAPMTRDDLRLLSLAAINLREPLLDKLATPPIGPTISDNKKAADVILLLIGSDPNTLRPVVDQLRAGLAAAEGYTVVMGGPAAAQTDLIEVYGKIDSVLLLVTALAVLLILIVVYRSPILPFVVLGVAGTGLGLANGVAYLLAKAGVYTITGQVQGILDVLVLGAGTDYALLLASRFREELRRTPDKYQAMWSAWRASVEPIAASGGTVVLALLCLLVSGLPATRSLGPVAAIGIGFAVVSMLVLLPAILVLLGRAAFWPFRPAFGSVPAERRGGWSRVAQWVGRRPRIIWAVTLVAMLGLALGAFQLQSSGIPRTAGFLTAVDSIAGEKVLEENFPAASGTPAEITGRADHLDAMVAAIRGVPNVSEIKPFLDPLAEYDNRQKGIPAPPPKQIDGRVRIRVTLSVPADSPAAATTVRAIRDLEHGVPGADAQVGGYTASNLDVEDVSAVDRAIVIPLVLLLVFGILVLLLRAVIAPLVLIGTVILSYVATLGVCGLVFTHVFGFAGSETSFPMYAFVFLVALGVDYNIFLMTRVREEVARHGHRAGTLAGLSVTGGVVTSAGIVVAATFAALSVIPLVYLAELAFAVAFGVLLDTLVVRTLLVPALTLDIGRFVWWPSKLRNSPP